MTECRYITMCVRRWSPRIGPCGEDRCWMYRPMPDVKALVEVADELEGEGLDFWASGPVNVGEYARRIRKALGVSDG